VHSLKSLTSAIINTFAPFLLRMIIKNVGSFLNPIGCIIHLLQPWLRRWEWEPTATFTPTLFQSVYSSFQADFCWWVKN